MMAGWHFTYEPEVLAWWNDGPPPLSSAAIAAMLRRVPPVCLPALVAHEHEREAQRAGLLPFRRGMVLRKTTKDSYEVGVVVGPATHLAWKASHPGEGGIECLHGWIDNPPAAGRFEVSYAQLRRGLWVVATPEDEAIVRGLFVAHARERGPSSAAWAGEKVSGRWTTPPIAKRWNEEAQRAETRGP